MDINILTMPFPKNKVLYMTLKKIWFDQIKYGIKTKEFREDKPYWRSRLMNKDGTWKVFDYILFKNGYSKNSPKLWVEFKGVGLGHSPFYGDNSIIIHLGKVLDYDVLLCEEKDKAVECPHCGHTYLKEDIQNHIILIHGEPFQLSPEKDNNARVNQ